MQIRKVASGVYDIFGDIGFTTWTRVRKFHWGIKPVLGAALPRNAIKKITEMIDRFPNGNINNV